MQAFRPQTNVQTKQIPFYGFLCTFVNVYIHLLEYSDLLPTNLYNTCGYLHILSFHIWVSYQDTFFKIWNLPGFLNVFVDLDVLMNNWKLMCFFMLKI